MATESTVLPTHVAIRTSPEGENLPGTIRTSPEGENLVASVPNHIAIIPDGNRRWAKARGKSIHFGHKMGAERSYELVRTAAKRGVKTITFWAFSTENWRRSPREVAYLLRLFAHFTKKWIREAKKENIQLRFIGDLRRFPPDLRRLFRLAVEDTRHNTRIVVNIALNYGGRDELLRAVKKVIKQGVTSLTGTEFERHLDTNGLPDPDLVIRTSGEQRLSGLLPWQAAYAELYFTKVHFPDFSSQELDKALKEFARRQRRFGA